MKKLSIIAIMLIMLSPTQSVKALTTTYYSEYGDFSAWTMTPIQKTDINKVETERRYMWYKETTQQGDYYLEDENDPEYPLMNIKDFKKSEWTTWKEQYPEIKKNREIKSKQIYKYQDMEKVRYLHFDQFEGTNNQLDIIELKVKIDGSIIEYDAICEKCQPEFIDKIKNNSLQDAENKIASDDYLRIDLKEWYSLDQIEFELYLKDQTENRKAYHYYYTSKPEHDSQIYAESIYYHWFQTTDNETHQIIHDLEDTEIKDPEWSDIKISESEIPSTPTRQVQAVTYYQYQDTMYRYYKTERVYAKNYSKDGYITYPIKDTSNYQDYYREQKRDKVVIDSHIVITSSKSKLEDFITETTTKKIIIEGDYDLKKNGTYQVQFVLPFKTVNRTIYVDINNQKELENENKKLQKEIETLTKKSVTTAPAISNRQNTKNAPTPNQVEENYHQQNTTWLMNKLEKQSTSSSELQDIECVCEDTISKIEHQSSFHYLILLLLIPLSILYKKIRTKNVELK